MTQTGLYKVTVLPLIKGLKAQLGILDKVQAHVATRATERHPLEYHLSALFNDRLIFDQFPFIRQIQVATDLAKGGACRLAQIEIPKFEDNEKTMEELKARLNKTIALLESVKPEQVDGKEELKIELPFYPGKYLNGFEYANEFVLPNFYFHLTTAYSILRKNGIEIGKNDFIGSLPTKDL